MKEEVEDSKQHDLERVSVSSDGSNTTPLTKREIQGWYGYTFTTLQSSAAYSPLSVLLFVSSPYLVQLPFLAFKCLCEEPKRYGNVSLQGASFDNHFNRKRLPQRLLTMDGRSNSQNNHTKKEGGGGKKSERLPREPTPKKSYKRTTPS
jgi:hypothetical protein